MPISSASKNTPRQNHPAPFAKRCGTGTQGISISPHQHGGREKGHTNKIACYSKYPILSARVLDYSSEYNGSVLYEVKIGEDTVTLINNHLESNKLTKADKAVYENMLKSPEKEKVKSGMRLLIRN